jgi:membrane-associated phospholipid phosphatase
MSTPSPSRPLAASVVDRGRRWQSAALGEVLCRPLAITAVGVILAAVCSVTVDLPAAHAARNVDAPSDLVRLIYLAEVFAHGTGVLMILAVIGSLQPQTWRRLLWVAASAFVPGLAADGVKLVVQRMRPQAFETLPATALDSFAGILGQHWNALAASGAAELQAFPSAHTATAFGFAFGLRWYFGRGSAVFFLCAALAAWQRIACGAHWPSDLVSGALLAFLISPPLLRRADRNQSPNAAGHATIR